MIDLSLADSLKKSSTIVAHLLSGSSMQSSLNSYKEYKSQFSIEGASQQLYRFGYIANVGVAPTLTGELSTVLSNWISKKVGTLHFFLHPETSFWEASTPHSTVVIVGHVFDAIKGNLDSQNIVEELAQYKLASQEFLQYLDNLAGRYLVFVNNGSGWTVYPDAFSSKMRYFSPEALGTVASHATLIANACGLPLDFDIQGYMLSDSYRKRDVKNLPGLSTEYESLFVAPANHSLELTGMNLKRFWPRENICHNDTALAEQTFITYLDNYSNYIVKNFDTDVFGLTAGMDSRTMLAPLLAKSMDIEAFTLLRGGESNRKDMEGAKALAAKFGFSHTPINVATASSRLEGYFHPNRKALRMNGGPHRLNAIYSNDAFFKQYKDVLSDNCSFTRGFGGEIIRGFYQKSGQPLQKATASKFAGLTGILGDSELVKLYFQHFIDNLDYDKCFDADLFDIFYMEHRMSKWAANSLSETDATAHSIVGMSCRKLYEVNMGLPFEYRKSREVFKKSIAHFCPELLDIEIS